MLTSQSLVFSHLMLICLFYLTDIFKKFLAAVLWRHVSCEICCAQSCLILCLWLSSDNETSHVLSCVFDTHSLSSDNETRPHDVELSIIVSQDCDHALTTDLILTFYQHNITHITVPFILVIVREETRSSAITEALHVPQWRLSNGFLQLDNIKCTVLRNSPEKYHDLETWVGVIQGHCNWHRLLDRTWLLVNVQWKLWLTRVAPFWHIWYRKYCNLEIRVQVMWRHSVGQIWLCIYVIY